jgi:hypothetical protein
VSDDPHARELADNKRLWEAWTSIHTTGSFYDVERFRRDPADLRIRGFERDDVTGKTLLRWTSRHRRSRSRDCWRTRSG